MYQTFPPFHANRQVRRSIRQGRESRLPVEWRQALIAYPQLRQLIKESR